MSFRCEECSTLYATKRTLERHWRDEHWDPEYETPDEHLGGDDSEQRDFAGEEPDDSDYDPQYVEVNDPPDTEKTRLEDYE